MAFLTDEDREPAWDPFARLKQTEEVEPDAGPAPVQSWGTGARGRPSEVDPGEQMSRVIRGQLEWLRHGIPPRRHMPEGLGFVPPTD